MAAQRRHTLVVGRRGADPDESYEAADRAVRAAETPAWRPFQLAFVLVNLPGLTDPAHPERAANHDAAVDVLFFPTGGGKTEALFAELAPAGIHDDVRGLPKCATKVTAESSGGRSHQSLELGRLVVDVGVRPPLGPVSLRYRDDHPAFSGQ